MIFYKHSTKIFISFMSYKYFNVSTVGVVCSLYPLFVCVIACLLLNETMKLRDVMTLTGVFISVILVIVYSNAEEAETMKSNRRTNISRGHYVNYGTQFDYDIQ